MTLKKIVYMVESLLSVMRIVEGYEKKNKK